MGNILPILISFKLHKEHMEQRQRRLSIKEEEPLLLKEENRFCKMKNNNTNNM